MNKNRYIGTIFSLIAVFFWASTYAATKIGLEQIPPLTMAFLRSVIAMVFLLIIVLIRQEAKMLYLIFKNNLFFCFFTGLTGVFLLNLFQNYSMERTSSSLASVLINVNPILILIFAIFFLQEKINKNKIIGIIIGFIGMIFIVLVGQKIIGIFTSRVFIGNLLAIGGAASWAAYSIINKKISLKYNAFIITLTSFIIGTILLFISSLFLENLTIITTLSVRSWIILFYLGIFGSGVAFLCWNLAISKLDASKAAIFLYLIPVLTIIIGMTFLHESLTLFNIIGAILILSGIYISEKKC